MIEVVAAVNLPRLARGQVAVVDETDERVKRLIRGGYLVPIHPAPAKKTDA